MEVYRKQRYLQLSNYHSRVLENISILSRTCFTSVVDTSWEGKPQGILILTCNDEIKKEIQIPWVMLSVITTQVIKILPVMDLVNPVEQDPTEDTAYQRAMERRRNGAVVQWCSGAVVRWCGGGAMNRWWCNDDV